MIPIFENKAKLLFIGDEVKLVLGDKEFRTPTAMVEPEPADTDGFRDLRFDLLDKAKTGVPVSAIVSSDGSAVRLRIEVKGAILPDLVPDDIDVSNGDLSIRLREFKLEFEPLPGHVHVSAGGTAGATALLQFSKTNTAYDTVRLAGAAGLVLTLEIGLFWEDIPGRSMGIPIEVAAEVDARARYAFAAAFSAHSAQVNGSVFYSWRESGVESGKLSLFENRAAWQIADVADPLLLAQRSIVGFAERALLSGAEALTCIVRDVTFGQPRMELTADGLSITGLRARIAFDSIRDGSQGVDGELLLDGEDFKLNPEFLLVTEGPTKPEPRLIFALAGDVVLLGGAEDELLLTGAIESRPLSIHFMAGTKFIFSLDPRNPYLALESGKKAKAPVAKVYVPGLAGGTFPKTGTQIIVNADALAERFVLEFPGENLDGPEKTRCRITPQGAQMTAEAPPQSIQMGGTGKTAVLRDVRLEHGRLTLDRGDYDLDIAASGRLGYFEHTSGRLTVRANSRSDGGTAGGQNFAARFDVQIDAPWEDPTGSIQVIDPGATIGIGLGSGGWSVTAWVSGTLKFKGVQALMGEAADWLKDLVGDLALRFDGLALHEMLPDMFGDGTPGEPAEAERKVTSLKIQFTGARELSLWKVLRFELTEFGLARNAVVLAGKVHFTLEGGFYFMGSIPRLRISLKDGIDFDTSQPLDIEGKLVTSTGISGSLSLRRESEPGRQRMVGHGTLVLPAWPGVDITCGFGRREVAPGQWIPMLFLFIQADIPITVFPCVVLRDLGVGFGINQKLRGFDSLWGKEDAFENLMKDPRGLPDPANTADWEDGGGVDHTDIAFVARTHVAPSPKTRGPFPYVADAMIYIQPTSEFTIAFTSNLWLFSGLDDVRKPEFRSNPVAKTMIVMYPRHGYLEARARTMRDSKMKEAVPPVKTALSLVEAEAYLKATPDMFRMRVGPMVASLTESGFDLRGSMLYGVELGNGVAIMLMQQTLSGAFDLSWSFGLSLGPLEIHVGLEIHARMGYSILLAGGYISEEVGIAFYGLARAYASIEIKVSLSLSFHLRIDLGWFGEIDISWSMSLAANLAIGFTAELEALVGSEGVGLKGAGTLFFDCCGFSFSTHIAFNTGETRLLEDARRELQRFLPEGGNALTPGLV